VRKVVLCSEVSSAYLALLWYRCQVEQTHGLHYEQEPCISTALACGPGLKIHATGLMLTCFPSHTRPQDAEVSTYALHNFSCMYLNQNELESVKIVIIAIVIFCVHVQLT